MRDLVVKAFTSADHKRRQLLLTEYAHSRDFDVTTKKCWRYAIKDSLSFDDVKQLESWLKKHTAARAPASIRNLQVVRKFNRHTGENKFRCKAAGDLFAINGSSIFAVRFFYSFSIEVASEKIFI